MVRPLNISQEYGCDQSMAETRTFYVSGIDLTDLANRVSSWLVLNDFESRTINLPGGGIAVQARQPASWRYILGMSSALNITFSMRGSNLVVDMDAGRWADKVAVGAVGALILHPLLITTAYGVWKQSQLPDKVFRVVEQYVNERQGPAAGATRITIHSPGEPIPEKAIPEKASSSTPEETICPSCGQAATEGAKYCDQCGARLKPVSVNID